MSDERILTENIEHLLEENDRLRSDLASKEKEIERLRMQLAACGVVAMENTPESAREARDMHQDYWSASAGDVANAVDREMKLRTDLASRDAEIAELRALLQMALPWLDTVGDGGSRGQVVDDLSNEIARVVGRRG